MNSKKKNEIKAKHVLGELTLGDVLPLVENKCGSVVIVNGEGDESHRTYLNFTEERLEVYRDEDDDDPEYNFPVSLKVRWRDDHVDVLGHSYKIYFREHKPIKIKIL